MENGIDNSSWPSMLTKIVDLNSLHKKAETIDNTGEILAPILDVKDEEIGNYSFLVEEIHKDLPWSTLIKCEMTSIKGEPEWNQLEIKQFSEDTCMYEPNKIKPELIVKVEHELSEKNVECFFDSSDQISGTSIYGSENFSPKEIEVPVKTEASETVSDIEKRHEIVFVELKIKHEDVDVKHEYCEQNQIVMSSGGEDQEKRDEYKKHKCHACGYRTRHKGHLNRHLLQHRDPEEVVTLKCDQCNYKTIHKKSLDMHLLLHENPENVNFFRCEQCEYRSLRKYDLNRHILRHKGLEKVDTFKCNQCEYKTLQKGNLKRHLLLHKELKIGDMFNCDKCQFKTIYRHNLILHLLQHGNRKENGLFKCDQCEYQALQKGHLKRHVLHKHPKECRGG